MDSEHGIRGWLKVVGSKDLTKGQLGTILVGNENKQKNLDTFKLPTFRVICGFNDSLDDITKSIPPEELISGRFHLRCVPKDSNGDRISLLDLTWIEVQNTVEKLAGGKEKYTIEVKEYWKPDFKGAIVVDSESRRVVLELAEGDVGIKSGRLGLNLTKGELNLEGGISFIWDGKPTEEQRNTMLQALKYFVPDLKKEELEKLSNLYVEFVFSREHGFRFLDIADEQKESKFWSKLDIKEKKLNPNRPEDYGLKAYSNVSDEKKLNGIKNLLNMKADEVKEYNGVPVQDPKLLAWLTQNNIMIDFNDIDIKNDFHKIVGIKVDGIKEYIVIDIRDGKFYAYITHDALTNYKRL